MTSHMTISSASYLIHFSKNQKDSMLTTAKRQLDQSKALINSALILTKVTLTVHAWYSEPYPPPTPSDLNLI